MDGFELILLGLCLVASGFASKYEDQFSPRVKEFLATDWDARRTGNYELDYKSMWMELARIIELDPVLKADSIARVSNENLRGLEYPFPPFDCDSIPPSDPVPSTVHALRAGDIHVISAVGDSISAGFGVGADNFREVGDQNRGEVFSIGGNDNLEKQVITMTNFLRKYNPDLKGYSRCRSGPSDVEYAWMNRAVGGATCLNMATQARDVVEKAQNDSRIDFQNDWKMVTLWVGGNDLCASCRRPEDFDPIPHRQSIEEGLDILHAQLPRAIINVIVMFDVTPLPLLSTGPMCDVLHRVACSCAVNNDTSLLLRGRQEAYYYELSQLIECSGKYDDKDDFTVVLHPMMRDLTPPLDPDTGEYDPTFLSYDCFHPSRKAHQFFAHGLWDSLWIPVGQKPFNVDISNPDIVYSCPTENTFIATNMNSKAGWVAPSGARREEARPMSAGAPRPTLDVTTPLLTFLTFACFFWTV